MAWSGGTPRSPRSPRSAPSSRRPLVRRRLWSWWATSGSARRRCGSTRCRRHRTPTGCCPAARPAPRRPSLSRRLTTCSAACWRRYFPAFRNRAGERWRQRCTAVPPPPSRSAWTTRPPRPEPAASPQAGVGRPSRRIPVAGPQAGAGAAARRGTPVKTTARPGLADRGRNHACWPARSWTACGSCPGTRLSYWRWTTRNGSTGRQRRPWSSASAAWTRRRSRSC